jgi:hypothetical protein
LIRPGKVRSDIAHPPLLCQNEASPPGRVARRNSRRIAIRASRFLAQEDADACPGFHPRLAFSRRRDSGRGIAPLVLKLLLGDTPSTAARSIAPNGKKPARGGWPAGKPRGPRQATATAKAAPEAKAKTDKPADAAKSATPTDKQLQAARRRTGDKKQAARNGTASNGAANGQGTTPHGDDLAVRVWQHAATLQPGAPWRALRSHGILDSLALDAYRVTRLPPGFGPRPKPQPFLPRRPATLNSPSRGARGPRKSLSRCRATASPARCRDASANGRRDCAGRRRCRRPRR